MIRLSPAFENAFKTGLAMAIAYGIALSMGWERPYWAGFAVAMISLGTAGQSLQKGAMRMLGTLVAVSAALTFIALFPQERWLFLITLSVYVGFCTYMMTGPAYQYFWQVSAFVCMVVAADGGPDPVNAFNTAIERGQETGLGILVYSLIGALLWPRSSVGELERASREVGTAQRQLFEAYRRLLAGRETAEAAHGLRMQEIQQLAHMAQLLGAARTESYQVWELRRQWARHVVGSEQLGTALERWRETFPEIREFDLDAILPDLDGLLAELGRRFEQIEQLLAGESADAGVRPMTLTIERGALGRLSHFQIAAVTQTRSQLERLEQLSRSLFHGLRDLKGFGPPVEAPAVEAMVGRRPVFDPDRFQAALRVVATLVIAFLLWVYVDPPGHAGFVSFAPTIALAAATMPQLPVVSMVLPFAGGCVFAGVLYVFVMPHLSGYFELGSMMFLSTFAIYYLFAAPRQAMAKLGAIIPFVVLISVQNQQTYDFAGYANSVAMIMLGFALVIATAYIPTSPRPEKAFLRLLGRFFRQGEALLLRVARSWDHRQGLYGRLATLAHRNALLALPDQLEAWARQVEQAGLPAGSGAQAQALAARARALAYRLAELVEALDRPQAGILVQALLGDVRPWRQTIQQLFADWAASPGADAGDLQARLVSKLSTLEKRVDAAFASDTAGQLQAADFDNLYRVLGAYRGLSEAVVAYDDIAREIPWPSWQEARF